MNYQVIEIGNRQSTTLITYFLDRSANGKKRPVIIICPGGGFLDCSPFEGEPVALHFNRAGFHAAILVYSTQKSNPGTPAFPQDVYELAESVKLLREHADKWEIDADQIVILGFSAGANVCGIYENCWKSDFLTKIGTPGQLKPNAAILCYPMLDVRWNQESFTADVEEMDLNSVTGGKDERMKAQAFWKLVNVAQFGCEYPSEEQIRQSSPIFNVNKDTPPTFIWHTFADPLLSPLQSLEYAKQLFAYRIPCELHIYEKGKHGLSLADETSAKKASDIDLHIATWSTLAVEWLKSIFED